MDIDLLLQHFQGITFKLLELDYLDCISFLRFVNLCAFVDLATEALAK